MSSAKKSKSAGKSAPKSEKRLDVVLPLGGDLFILADRKSAEPAFQLKIAPSDRTVVRVLIDEPLSREEKQEVIESFTQTLSLPSGGLVLRTIEREYEDESEEDSPQEVVKVPKGTYRMTLHTTIASPATPAKLGKETLKAYFKRTRPGEPLPSWLEPEERNEDFWVGFIVQLETDAGAKPATSAQPFRSGKNAIKPEVCPAGLRSDKPRGWENYVQTDLHYTHAIPKLVAKLRPQPLQGGPVSVPIRELILPYWIAWICGETHPRVEIDCPSGFPIAWPGFKQGIKETKSPKGWQVDIEGMNARWTQFGHLRQLASLLEGLPDGSRIRLDCADNENESLEGRQRYHGKVKAGQWRIEQTYPKMKAERLTEMLDLVRQGETGLTVTALDEEEAERVEEAIHTQDFLLRENPPKRKGLEFRLSSKHADLMPFLLSWAFKARFPDDLPAMNRDGDLEDWDNLMDDIAKAGGVFATGEVIFKGRFANFTLTDVGTVQTANHKLITSYDRSLISLGFKLLGDLHSTQTFQAVFRGYILPDQPIYGAIIESGFGSVQQDFYTRFPDGFSLTTALANGTKSTFKTEKKKKAYHAEVIGEMADRLREHRSRVASLAAVHGVPQPAGDLAAFAYELDDFFCREYEISSKD